MERIETTILRNLIFDEEYSRKVIPFIQPDYFENKTEKIIFEEATQFIVKYDAAITIEALNIEIENRTDLTEGEIKEARETTKTFDDAPVDNQWLLDSTEKWCRDRAIYLALMESIALADGQDDKKGRDAIPSILSDALAVSFDNHIGHDYLEDYEERYESYHRKESRGAHSRIDYSERDDKKWLKHSLIWANKEGKTETRFRKVNLQTNSKEIKTIEPKARVY